MHSLSIGWLPETVEVLLQKHTSSFTNTANTDSLLSSLQKHQVLDRAKHTFRKSLFILIGPKGTGKKTLLGSLLPHLSPKQKVCFLQPSASDENRLPTSLEKENLWIILYKDSTVCSDELFMNIFNLANRCPNWTVTVVLDELLGDTSLFALATCIFLQTPPTLRQLFGYLTSEPAPPKTSPDFFDECCEWLEAHWSPEKISVQDALLGYITAKTDALLTSARQSRQIQPPYRQLLQEQKLLSEAQNQKTQVESWTSNKIFQVAWAARQQTFTFADLLNLAEKLERDRTAASFEPGSLYISRRVSSLPAAQPVFVNFFSVDQQTAQLTRLTDDFDPSLTDWHLLSVQSSGRILVSPVFAHPRLWFAAQQTRDSWTDLPLEEYYGCKTPLSKFLSAALVTRPAHTTQSAALWWAAYHLPTDYTLHRAEVLTKGSVSLPALRPVLDQTTFSLWTGPDRDSVERAWTVWPFYTFWLKSHRFGSGTYFALNPQTFAADYQKSRSFRTFLDAWPDLSEKASDLQRYSDWPPSSRKAFYQSGQLFASSGSAVRFAQRVGSSLPDTFRQVLAAENATRPNKAKVNWSEVLPVYGTALSELSFETLSLEVPELKVNFQLTELHPPSNLFTLLADLPTACGTWLAASLAQKHYWTASKNNQKQLQRAFHRQFQNFKFRKEPRSLQLSFYFGSSRENPLKTLAISNSGQSAFPTTPALLENLKYTLAKAKSVQKRGQVLSCVVEVHLAFRSFGEVPESLELPFSLWRLGHPFQRDFTEEYFSLSRFTSQFLLEQPVVLLASGSGSLWDEATEWLVLLTRSVLKTATESELFWWLHTRRSLLDWDPQSQLWWFEDSADHVKSLVLVSSTDRLITVFKRYLLKMREPVQSTFNISIPGADSLKPRISFNADNPQARAVNWAKVQGAKSVLWDSQDKSAVRLVSGLSLLSVQLQSEPLELLQVNSVVYGLGGPNKPFSSPKATFVQGLLDSAVTTLQCQPNQVFVRDFWNLPPTSAQPLAVVNCNALPLEVQLVQPSTLHLEVSPVVDQNESSLVVRSLFSTFETALSLKVTFASPETPTAPRAYLFWDQFSVRQQFTWLLQVLQVELNNPATSPRFVFFALTFDSSRSSVWFANQHVAELLLKELLSTGLGVPQLPSHWYLVVLPWIYQELSLNNTLVSFGNWPQLYPGSAQTGWQVLFTEPVFSTTYRLVVPLRELRNRVFYETELAGQVAKNFGLLTVPVVKVNFKALLGLLFSQQLTDTEKSLTLVSVQVRWPFANSKLVSLSDFVRASVLSLNKERLLIQSLHGRWLDTSDEEFPTDFVPWQTKTCQRLNSDQRVVLVHVFDHTRPNNDRDLLWVEGLPAPQSTESHTFALTLESDAREVLDEMFRFGWLPNKGNTLAVISLSKNNVLENQSRPEVLISLDLAVQLESFLDQWIEKRPTQDSFWHLYVSLQKRPLSRFFSHQIQTWVYNDSALQLQCRDWNLWWLTQWEAFAAEFGALVSPGEYRPVLFGANPVEKSSGSLTEAVLAEPWTNLVLFVPKTEIQKTRSPPKHPVTLALFVPSGQRDFWNSAPVAWATKTRQWFSELLGVEESALQFYNSISSRADQPLVKALLHFGPLQLVLDPEQNFDLVSDYSGNFATVLSSSGQYLLRDHRYWLSSADNSLSLWLDVVEEFRTNHQVYAFLSKQTEGLTRFLVPSSLATTHRHILTFDQLNESNRALVNVYFSVRCLQQRANLIRYSDQEVETLWLQQFLNTDQNQPVVWDKVVLLPKGFPVGLALGLRDLEATELVQRWLKEQQGFTLPGLDITMTDSWQVQVQKLVNLYVNDAELAFDPSKAPVRKFYWSLSPSDLTHWPKQLKKAALLAYDSSLSDRDRLQRPKKHRLCWMTPNWQLVPWKNTLQNPNLLSEMKNEIRLVLQVESLQLKTKKQKQLNNSVQLFAESYLTGENTGDILWPGDKALDLVNQQVQVQRLPAYLLTKAQVHFKRLWYWVAFCTVYHGFAPDEVHALADRWFKLSEEHIKGWPKIQTLLFSYQSPTNKVTRLTPPFKLILLDYLDSTFQLPVEIQHRSKWLKEVVQSYVSSGKVKSVEDFEQRYSLVSEVQDSHLNLSDFRTVPAYLSLMLVPKHTEAPPVTDQVGSAKNVRLNFALFKPNTKAAQSAVKGVFAGFKVNKDDSTDTLPLQVVLWNRNLVRTGTETEVRELWQSDFPKVGGLPGSSNFREFVARKTLRLSEWRLRFWVVLYPFVPPLSNNDASPAQVFAFQQMITHPLFYDMKYEYGNPLVDDLPTRQRVFVFYWNTEQNKLNSDFDRLNLLELYRMNFYLHALHCNTHWSTHPMFTFKDLLQVSPTTFDRSNILFDRLDHNKEAHQPLLKAHNKPQKSQRRNRLNLTGWLECFANSSDSLSYRAALFWTKVVFVFVSGAYKKTNNQQLPAFSTCQNATLASGSLLECSTVPTLSGPAHCPILPRLAFYSPNTKNQLLGDFYAALAYLLDAFPTARSLLLAKTETQTPDTLLLETLNKDGFYFTQPALSLHDLFVGRSAERAYNTLSLDLLQSQSLVPKSQLLLQSVAETNARGFVVSCSEAHNLLQAKPELFTVTQKGALTRFTLEVPLTYQSGFVLRGIWTFNAALSAFSLYLLDVNTNIWTKYQLTEKGHTISDQVSTELLKQLRQVVIDIKGKQSGVVSVQSRSLFFVFVAQ